MNVLILSCNTGQGHNSVSDAIKKTLQARGHRCKVVDSMQFNAHWVATVMAKGHTFVYRHLPWLFRWGYEYTEMNRGVFHADSIIFRFLTRGSGRLYHYCVDNQFDVVIAAHVFSGLILTDAKKRFPLNVKTYFVATDYTCSPSVDQSDLDGYFIPSKMLSEEFAKCGIPRERLIPSGIPVRPEFFKHIPKEEAKRQLGIPADHTHLLMMGGSMGCGPMKRLALRLAHKMHKSSDLTIVCGTNDKLYQILSRRLDDYDNVHIIKYTDNVPLLMDSADLYVTKPGGVSVTEAAVKCLPMVFVNAVAGCEEYNMHYYIQRGCGVSAKGVFELSKLCLSLLKETDVREQMAQALQALDTQDAAAFICDYLCEDMKK